MPYLGDFLVFTATGTALASLVLYFMAWRGREDVLILARRFFHISTAAIGLSLVALLYLILTHDFSVVYVFSYSSTDLPPYYLFASLWGGQEGTFLMWILFTAVMGLVMIRTAGSFEKGNMVFLNLFILSILFILLKKSPFEIMPVFRTEGSGLNPLLQNYWMTIHPPIMFVGFAGAVIPFCFAMTALVERKYHIWSQAARRWTIFAWAALGVALVMGGYWAYETLGWGGFWAWDPVENSSLIPWIFLTTQIHALFIKRQRRGLLRFSLIAVCLSFWSVMYGTFLTRSGVLADFSVHSFVDLGINQFLIGGLLFFVIAGLALLIWRWRDISPEPSYSSVASRSYLVTLGVIILSLGGALVLVGTSAPLLTRVTENPSAVGLTYYFNTMTPIAVALLFLIGLFPAFRWNNGLAKPLLLMLGGAAALVTVIILMITGFTMDPLYLALFGGAAWALVSNSWVFIVSMRGTGKLQAGYLSHVGLALALIGAAVSAGFARNEMVQLRQNETVSVMGYDMRFTHIQNTPKGFDCMVEVSNASSSYTAVLPHEFPKNSDGVMRKPYVKNNLGYDLYLAPVAFDEPKGTPPGQLYLTKGETASLGGYELTFHDFTIAGHDGMAAGDMTAYAELTVAVDGGTEDIRPALRVAGGDVTPVSASFDNGKGSIHVTGVNPDEGGVFLQAHGDFLPVTAATAAIVTVEVSKKPLILLFWLGTIIAFFGGGLSMVERRRRRGAVVTEATSESVSAVEHDVA